VVWNITVILLWLSDMNLLTLWLDVGNGIVNIFLEIELKSSLWFGPCPHTWGRAFLLYDHLTSHGCVGQSSVLVQLEERICILEDIIKFIVILTSLVAFISGPSEGVFACAEQIVPWTFSRSSSSLLVVRYEFRNFSYQYLSLLHVNICFRRYSILVEWEIQQLVFQLYLSQ